LWKNYDWSNLISLEIKGRMGNMFAANNHGKFDVKMLERTGPRLRNHAFW
jgi:hypothetical protein